MKERSTFLLIAYTLFFALWGAVYANAAEQPQETVPLHPETPNGVIEVLQKEQLPEKQPKKKAPAQPKASDVITEDAELKEQIDELHEILTELYQMIALRRLQIKQERKGAKKAALYAEVDRLQEEAADLQRVLRELIREATSTEWTEIDQAIQRIEGFERRQEYDERKEESLRDLQL